MGNPAEKKANKNEHAEGDKNWGQISGNGPSPEKNQAQKKWTNQ